VKICMVASPGGHLTELRWLEPAIEGHERFYVLNEVAGTAPQGERVYVVRKAVGWSLSHLVNIYEAWTIFRAEQPDLVISTGASVAVWFFLVGKFVFRCETIFVEVITRVGRPSLTGRISDLFVDHVYYQWPDQAKYFKRGRFEGTAV
jgi:beta-1,4-N-acetylglucosaminyltransferase